ncbi:MAG: B12-binding domain-containing radical SAM protein [Prolixibacteraceae bacterium]|nr:B12-binding domain-containing radical SAM protein [Prolixibacteraceae bacterium]MBN2772768.1 B12-binding domain-containing radical SAM protein [Prolixibacteraceae bacterium]
MKKPKLLIIVLFQNLGEEKAYYAKSPAPPISGALLAGLTPPIVEIELLHEMIRPIDYTTDADFIALSFMDFCLVHAIEVSGKFKKLGKKVVAGGRYASTFPEEIVEHMDATVVGEAEGIWPEVVTDLVNNTLKKIYYAPIAPPLDNIPPPRYDLIEKDFTVPVVTEATRGCIYKCSYCQLNIKPTPYRKRPVQDVINDLLATRKLPLMKRKIAMLQDNNLGGDMKYAKELLREIAKINLWALGVQFSFDCLHDDEFIDLLVEANCGLAFIGLESLNEPSLAFVHKKQNRTGEYKELFEKLKKRGILTFTGMMIALDEDTPEYYNELPAKLEEIDPSTILLSISIPIPGTPFHKLVNDEGRIIDGNLSHYEGDHLVFQPKNVSKEDVFRAYKNINRVFYSWKNIFRRWLRFIKTARFKGNFFSRFLRGAFLSVMMIRISVFQRDHAREKVYQMAAD